MTPAVDHDAEGRLVENILHFTHALRKAGVKVGTAQVETAIRAVAEAGFSRRIDFYHTLRATLITRAEHLEVFHQVFAMFWRDPDFLTSLMHMLSPQLEGEPERRKPDAGQRRAEEALSGAPQHKDRPQRDEIERQAILTWSGREVLRRKDFDQMSASELAEAERAVRVLDLPVKPILTRRTRPDRYGARPDPRATLRAARRRAGEIERIERKTARVRHPDLVALCDISGSMSVYSRMLLRYMHAVTHARDRGWGHVHAFTFGTSLTNVTRALRQNDPDLALATVGREASDWEGGTRIGAALERFNREWSRRVLTSGAVVILITDGLERDDPGLLDREAARLSRSAGRVIWLNPLLRWDGFAPRAGGVRTLLSHVDSFHACHSLDSLQALSDAFGQRGLRDRMLAEVRTDL
ncbi:MAG: Protein containing von Willebrand factor type A (vWA) domain [Rhodobacteraceae bacterium HLUCCO18]|nr:MAG: Protein containing von Willebrand factor type A (vWA) domain [Rhodobacteraceae bacterium HLUCCO18]